MLASKTSTRKRRRAREPMITRLMKKWLEELPDNLDNMTEEQKSVYTLYMNRIQKRLDIQLELTLWLAKNRPDILLGHPPRIIPRQDKPYHKRIQQLLLIIEILVQPHKKVWLTVNHNIQKLKQKISET